MSTDKKFYWIKLKTDFFNKSEIDFLLAQKNGCEYIVLYQMLCLISANNEGRLVQNMNEIIIPYDINKIVRDTKYFDFDTVALALDLYKKLGLVYVEDKNILRISNFDDLVGSETKSALEKRKYREKTRLIDSSNRTLSRTLSRTLDRTFDGQTIGQLTGQKSDNVLNIPDNVLKKPDNVQKKPDNVRQEIEKEIEIEKDIDKELDNYIDKYKRKNKEIIPKWIEHPELCVEEPASEEDIEELEKLLEKYK